MLCSISSVSTKHSSTNPTTTSNPNPSSASVNYNFIKGVITNVILDFKRTHQDRYNDPNFKALFTSDQWLELQGMGTSATYFA